MGEGCSLASGSQATVRGALQPFIVWPFHPHNPQLPPNSWLPLPTSPDSALHPSPALVTFPGSPCLIPADLLPTSPSSVHGSKPMDRTPSPPRISPSSSLSLVHTPLFLQPPLCPWHAGPVLQLELNLSGYRVLTLVPGRASSPATQGPPDLPGPGSVPEARGFGDMDKTCSRKALMRHKGEGLSFLSPTAAPSHQPPPLNQLLEEMVPPGGL